MISTDRYLIALLIWNVAVMLIYGIDKLLAKAHRRRISENTLLMSAFLLGGAGGILGMVLFNHKTSKIKFRILVPVSMIVLMCVLFLYH